MMSEPLPSAWHSAPSEARRWIETPLSSTSLPLRSSCFSSSLSPSLPLLSLLRSAASSSSTLSSFVRLRSSSYRAAASPVLRTATRANISTGSSRGHGVTVDGSRSCFSIPRNYHGATMGVHSAGSASSAGYVLTANDPRAASAPLFFGIPAVAPPLRAALIIVNAHDHRSAGLPRPAGDRQGRSSRWIRG